MISSINCTSFNIFIISEILDDVEDMLTFPQLINSIFDLVHFKSF